MVSLRLCPIFALLLLVAHVNCVFEHQIWGAEFPITSEVPAPDSDDDHELKGCICKGAIVADSTVIGIDNNSFEKIAFDSIDQSKFGTWQVFFSRDSSPENLLARWPLLVNQRLSILQVFLF